MARPKKSNGTAVAATVEETPAQEFTEHRLAGEIPVRGVVDAVPAAKPEIVHVPVEIRKNGFTREQIELLKRTVAKGASDEELDFFLNVCKRTGLDPFTHQIFFVPRWSRKENRMTYAIQVGVDGFRAVAQRSGKYAGQDEPEYEYATAGKRPSVAKVKVYHKDFPRPVVGVAFWDEIAPKDLSKPEAMMWEKMPRHMLAKCAEALALRKAFPNDLSGLYIDAEMHQTADDEPETIAAAPVANVPAKQNPGGMQEARIEPQPTAAPSAPAPAGSKTDDNNGVPRAQIPTDAEIQANAKQKSFTVPSEETAPSPAQATQGLADSIPQRAEGTAHDAAAYQPLPESAKNSERITSMNKFCFVDARTPDWLVWYLPFAVGEPSMLNGPYIIENATGIFQPKKCSEAINSLPDRKARFIFMENQLAEQGKDRFIAWGRAMIDAARARGVFGKK